jgi:methyl-accepting chemotaxis protein
LRTGPEPACNTLPAGSEQTLVSSIQFEEIIAARRERTRSDSGAALLEFLRSEPAAIEQQGAATQEISRNVEEAAKGTAQVATTIGEVKGSAVETGTASKRVLTAAGNLSKEGGLFRNEVDKFLSMVRAA